MNGPWQPLRDWENKYICEACIKLEPTKIIATLDSPQYLYKYKLQAVVSNSTIVHRERYKYRIQRVSSLSATLQRWLRWRATRDVAASHPSALLPAYADYDFDVHTRTFITYTRTTVLVLHPYSERSVNYVLLAIMTVVDLGH